MTAAYLADPRWHLLQDWASRLYASLGSDDQPTGVALSINADTGLPAALTASADRPGVRRVVFPDKHGNPVRIPDTAPPAELAGQVDIFDAIAEGPEL